MKKVFLIVLILLAFIQTTTASTISYDKSDFKAVYSVIDDASYDMRYYSSNNFTGNRINGYNAPIAYMTKEGVNALAIAANDLRNKGYRLLIWDTYRPQKAVDNFVVWINNPNDTGDKDIAEEVLRSRLFGGAGFYGLLLAANMNDDGELVIVIDDVQYICDIGQDNGLYLKDKAEEVPAAFIGLYLGSKGIPYYKISEKVTDDDFDVDSLFGD